MWIHCKLSAQKAAALVLVLSTIQGLACPNLCQVLYSGQNQDLTSCFLCPQFAVIFLLVDFYVLPGPSSLHPNRSFNKRHKHSPTGDNFLSKEGHLPCCFLQPSISTGNAIYHQLFSYGIVNWWHSYQQLVDAH